MFKPKKIVFLPKNNLFETINSEQNLDSQDILPREKLLKYGAQSLEDYELLAIFLRTGIKGLPVMEFAKHTLQHFGSLNAMLAATASDFTQIKGMGTTKYVQLQASLELAKRYLKEGLERGDGLNNPKLVVRYLQSILQNEEREVFAVLFLDTKNRVIQKEILFMGTIDLAPVYPREIVKKALNYNATSIIISHNHPSGCSDPSQSDKKVTYKIQQACKLVDIEVLDHVIVGKGEYFSFKEKGLI